MPSEPSAIHQGTASGVGERLTMGQRRTTSYLESEDSRLPGELIRVDILADGNSQLTMIEA